ncbi:MAG TPA: BamA/TamA family outer membrane protein, partial [Polyangiaceae bacterium]|nr:BamA/TamA family outer membrane protein [Polyangiaceae bacterium]
VPLTVVVEEANLRTIRLGGGMRLDELRLSFGLRASWENRNFLGGMRHLAVEARPGVALFPTRIGIFEWIRFLPQFRLNTRLRQPSFLEGRTTGFIEGEYGVFPVLYPIDTELSRAEIKSGEPVLGYHAVTTEAGVERSFWMHRLFVRPSYHWQANFPFYYREGSGVANKLEPIQVSFPELFTRIGETFDNVGNLDQIRVSLSNSLQVAGYIFGGDVSDIRLKPELRTILVGVFGKRTEVGARLGFGFLFPHGYGDKFDTSGTDGSDPSDPKTIEDQQTMLFRAFYSGGPTSNRGYPFRGVGPTGPVGFLLPSAVTVNCPMVLSNANADPAERAACTRPLGGKTLWEFSLEARFPLSGPVGGVVFIDASDVTPYHLGSTDGEALRLNVPHISPGVGLRYETPVGPLRLDLAYRVPGLQELGQPELSPQYGSPSGAADENFLGSYWLPLSLNFAIGESFD